MTIDLESLRAALKVLDDGIASLPELAALASSGEYTEVDPTEAIRRLETARVTVDAALAELTTRRARDADVGALVVAAKRANGDHTAPHDCYATGPSTGDDYLDLVSCPGCELAAALLPFAGAKP